MVPRSVLRLLVAFAMFVALGLASSAALAWVELTVARDDVRVEVSRNGKARVEHKILLLVSGGPLKSLVVRGVDADAEVEQGAYVVPEKDDKAGRLEGAEQVQIAKKSAESGSSAVSRTDLDVTLGEKGLSRGRYVVVFRYKTDLVASGSLVNEGATSNLRWMGPSWDDGLDATRASFVFPVAPSEPRAAATTDDGADSNDDARLLSTVTRRGATDMIELVRLYAARGERVLWTVRVDARAFDVAPSEGPSAPALPPHERRSTAPQAIGLELYLPAGFGLFVALAALVVLQGHEVKKRAKERQAIPRPLVPIPLLARACLASGLHLGGAWLVFLTRSTFAGALLSSAFTLFVWYLPARVKHEARPRGKWLPVRLAEVFGAKSAAPPGLFHLDGRRGKALASLLLIATIAGVAWASRQSLDLALTIACAGIPLLALFVTGGRRSLPVDLAVDPIPFLHEVALRLQRARPQLRLVPRIRLPEGRADADEIRLAVLPPEPVAGLRAVEVASGFAVGPAGHVLLPEILLRFENGTPCADIARSLEPSARKAPGRKLDERVLVFTPKLPAARLTAELVLAVLERVSQPRPKTAPPAAPPSDEKMRTKKRERVRQIETRTAA